MAKLKAKAEQAAAELDAKQAVAEAKKAAKEGAKAAKDLGAALTDQLKDAGLDERASELAQRAKDSEVYGRTQAKGQELAALARGKLHDSGFDERAEAWLEQAERMSDDTLEKLGAWLSTGPAAAKLGLEQKKRSRWTTFFAFVVGAGIGYVIATFTSNQRGEELRHDVYERAQELKDDLATVADRVQQDTRDVSAPPAEKPLADRIRTRLGEDPRTSDLPRLNINVAEGTVFVRGAVDDDVDQSAIRDVITAVPGVRDVDLQLT